MVGERGPTVPHSLAFSSQQFSFGWPKNSQNKAVIDGHELPRDIHEDRMQSIALSPST